MSIASEIVRLQGAKADLETSIEAKGVNIPLGETLDNYAGYVDLISTGATLDPLVDGAIAGEILTGKEAYSDQAVKLTGTMANVGAQSASISTKAGTVTPTQGYHNGLGSISIDATEQGKIISSNIKSGVTILGVAGDSNVVDTSSGDAIAGEILSGKKAFVDGSEVTGTMTDRTGDTACSSSSVSGTTLKLLASEGYRDGVNDYVTITDADFVASNIADGVDIFGLTGTLSGGALTDAIVIKTRNVDGYALTIDFYGTVVPIRAFYQYSLSYLSNYYYMTGVDFINTVTEVKDYAFYYCTSLALTALPSGVTSIGNYAFSGCGNIALTALPSGVTSIGNGAFSNCGNLALTALPSGVTSIGSSTFFNCTRLALTALPSGVTSIGTQAFQSCTSLANLNCPGVTSLAASTTSNSPFRSCTGLQSITFGSVGNAVTSMGTNPFYLCTQTGLVINIYVADPANPPSGVTTGAPWGATNATINYLQA